MRHELNRHHNDVQKKGGRVHLSGRGRVPEAPLCALCKVDGAFVLMAIDELTSLRPEMSKFVQDEAARKAEEEGKAADGDYKPKKEAAAARKNGDDAAASDSKATLSTVKVRCMPAHHQSMCPEARCMRASQHGCGTVVSKLLRASSLSNSTGGLCTRLHGWAHSSCAAVLSRVARASFAEPLHSRPWADPF